ncbi:hypothetical protein DFA_02695 [Cavenderia fasciculata]|uniref:GYF domain-containing protein n=1 Tax=Cavenderia fasciculata TaxID=261658 RepID=F4Q041_CACFS|nr:uncharacterized protein DFA_02695 [Cavenderia fasciculata]EGG18955.1 hypothetical protein DFA_02695 [Cavenderia fasciculata]|eukprot:XP_004357417.1 hypothetical protein DFA_02695 [Cavenderia fasciculata]
MNMQSGIGIGPMGQTNPGGITSPQSGAAKFASLSLSQLSQQTANMPHYNPPPQQQQQLQQQQQQQQLFTKTPNGPSVMGQGGYNQHQSFMRRSGDMSGMPSRHSGEFGSINSNTSTPSTPAAANSSSLNNSQNGMKYFGGGTPNHQHKSSLSSSTSSSPLVIGNKKQYSKEELLNLFNPSARVPDSLTGHSHILSEENQSPVNMNFVYDPANNLNKRRNMMNSSGGSIGIQNRGLGGRKDLDGNRISRDSPNGLKQQNKWNGNTGTGSNSASWRKEGGSDGGNRSGSYGGHQQNHPQWYYLDPQNVTQGPFPAKGMDEWHKAGYFTANLKVKRGETGRFFELKKLLSYVGNDSPFTMSFNVNDSEMLEPHELLDEEPTTEDEVSVDKEGDEFGHHGELLEEANDDDDEDEKILHGVVGEVEKKILGDDLPAPVVVQQPTNHFNDSQQSMPPIQSFFQQAQAQQLAQQQQQQQQLAQQQQQNNASPSPVQAGGLNQQEAMEVYQKYMLFQQQQKQEMQKIEMQMKQLIDQAQLMEAQLKQIYERSPPQQGQPVPLQLQQFQTYYLINQQSQRQLLQQYNAIKFMQFPQPQQQQPQQQPQMNDVMQYQQQFYMQQQQQAQQAQQQMMMQRMMMQQQQQAAAQQQAALQAAAQQAAAQAAQQQQQQEEIQTPSSPQQQAVELKQQEEVKPVINNKVVDDSSNFWGVSAPSSSGLNVPVPKKENSKLGVNNVEFEAASSVVVSHELPEKTLSPTIESISASIEAVALNTANPWASVQPVDTPKTDKRSLVEIQAQEKKDSKKREKENEERRIREEKEALEHQHEQNVLLKWAHAGQTWGNTAPTTAAVAVVEPVAPVAPVVPVVTATTPAQKKQPSLKDIQAEQQQRAAKDSSEQRTQQVASKSVPSIQDIMKEQAREEKRLRQQQQEQQQLQQQLQQQNAAQQQIKFNPSSPWGGVPPPLPVDTSLLHQTIDNNNKKSLNHVSQPIPNPTVAAKPSSNGGNPQLSIRTSTSSAPTSTPAHPQPVSPSVTNVNDDSFWDTPSTVGKSTMLNILPSKQSSAVKGSQLSIRTKQQQEKQQQEKQQQKSDFIKWCHQQLKPLTNMDVATVTELLCSLKKESEIRECARECLGFTTEVNNFINDYLMARSDEPTLAYESSSPFITVPKGKTPNVKNAPKGKKK